jgi:hypothetical protein
LLAWRDQIVSQALACVDQSEIGDAVAVLGRLVSATVDEDTLARTDHLLGRIAAGRTIVASFDPRRHAAAGEVVLVYGNYPHGFSNVVINNPIKRHVADFWRFTHDRVESDPRWTGIDRIFIINADRRIDRYDGVLRELAQARAPFDRLTRRPATMADWSLWGPAAGQIACLESHIGVLKQAAEAACDHSLILEDDFCFTSDLETHLDDLQLFVRRRYAYAVCLIATSKYGPVVPVDDLVARSHQSCTNTGGYLVSRDGVGDVLAIFEDALAQLKSSGRVEIYAADRCWRVLQPSGRFLVFRRKFGFQASSFSDIERSVSRYLD